MTTITHLSQARTLATSGEGRRIRQASQLSLTEVADAIGVTPATLARWERGLNRPRRAAALRWAAALADLTLPAAPTHKPTTEN